MTERPTPGAGARDETLDCGHVVRQLWDYLDGNLPEDRRAGIVAHLAWCAGCSSHFRFERAFLDTVARLRQGDADFDALRGQVLGALRAKGFSR